MIPNKITSGLSKINWNMTSIRHMAAPTGSKAKGGQAKTAAKKGGGPALPANAQLLSQTWLDLPLPPSELPPTNLKKLLNVIDFEHRLRHDPLLGDPKVALERKGQGMEETMLDTITRTQLLDASHPNRLRPGDVVLIETISSKTRPIKQQTVGMLLAIKRKGMGSHIIVRTQVMRTVVEYSFPVYSPLITRIKILSSQQKAKPGHNLETKSKLYHLRGTTSIYSRMEDAAKKVGIQERDLSNMLKESNAKQ